MDQITDSKLNITSMLDQRTQIPNTTNLSAEQQSTYTQLSSVYWRSGTRCNKNLIRLLSFKLLKSPRADEESNFKSRFHINGFYFPTGDSRKDRGLKIEFMEASLKLHNLDSLWLLLEVNRKRKPILAILYPWMDIKFYPSALIQMENIRSIFEYGLQRHRPLICSGLDFADNTFRNCNRKYQQWNSKIDQTLSVMEKRVQQDSILLS